MAKIQTEVTPVRLTAEMVDALRAFAERNNMYGKTGKPNVSEAARTIIALALSRGLPEDILAVAHSNARAEWLELVNGEWRRAMERLTDVGLRGI